MGIFEGKVAIITGGGKAKSIGYGVATAYAKEGANLVITGRNVQKLIDGKEELERLYGIKVLAMQCEGGDEEAVKATVKKTIETFGRIDVLINNAQASKSGVLLENHTKEDFDLAIYSGLYATFFFMRECFPYLKETKGAVINFASGAGLFGRVAQSSYAAAKEGIRGLSRVAATEWAPYGVNVNIVCPLAMTSELEHFKANYPDAYNATLKGVPMGRFGDPEKDIAESACSSALRTQSICPARRSRSRAAAVKDRKDDRCRRLRGLPHSLLFFLRLRDQHIQPRNQRIKQVPVLDVKDVMLFRAVIRKAAFRCGEQLRKRRQLFDIDDVVADYENRLPTKVNHIFTEHFLRPYIAEAIELFQYKCNIRCGCCHKPSP